MNHQPRGLHVQIRGLYRSLLESQSHFDEFKSFLVRYPHAPFGAEETALAADVRAQLNARIALWLGGDFDGLSARQVLQWRDIVTADDLDARVENEDSHDPRALQPLEPRAW